jgi:carbamoyltransferase
LLKDGEIIFYIEEERFSKIKQHSPAIIVDDSAEIRVPIENKKHYDLNYLLHVKSLEKLPKFTNKIDHVIFSSFGHRTDTIVINTVKDQLESILQIGKIHFYQEHHIYHACSSFYNSGFNSALSIVLDGGGFSKNVGYTSIFQELESVYLIDYNNISHISKHFSNYLHEDITDFIDQKKETFFSNSLSCGGLFNLVSAVIGLSGEPGKTMGLAPYGNDKNVEESWFTLEKQTDVWSTDTEAVTRSFEQRFEVTESLRMMIQNIKLSKVSESVAADLAKKTQVETRDHTIRLIEKYTKLTGEKNVVLSGGYFLNCSNNYEYIKRFPDLRFFVDPIAHDGGTAIGAAKYLWHKLTGDTTVRRLETLYLG